MRIQRVQPMTLGARLLLCPSSVFPSSGLGETSPMGLSNFLPDPCRARSQGVGLGIRFSNFYLCNLFLALLEITCAHDWVSTWSTCFRGFLSRFQAPRHKSSVYLLWISLSLWLGFVVHRFDGQLQFPLLPLLLSPLRLSGWFICGLCL